MAQRAITALLSIDDSGLDALSQRQCHDQFEVIEVIDGCGLPLITSQLPTRDCYEPVGEPTLGGAVV
ncbi:MAG: hypothetical protein ACI9BW_003580, partial [Gammaproteobacteria bacterium]